MLITRCVLFVGRQLTVCLVKYKNNYVIHIESCLLIGVLTII